MIRSAIEIGMGRRMLTFGIRRPITEDIHGQQLTNSLGEPIHDAAAEFLLLVRESVCEFRTADGVRVGLVEISEVEAPCP